MSEQKSNSQGTGIALLIVAVIIAVAVYSLRLPASLSEALMRTSHSPNAMVLSPTAYYIGMIIAGVTGIYGVAKLVRSVNNENK